MLKRILFLGEKPALNELETPLQACSFQLDHG